MSIRDIQEHLRNLDKTKFLKENQDVFSMCIWKMTFFECLLIRCIFKSIFDSLISATSDVHNIKYGLFQMGRAVPLQIGEMWNTKQ